MALNTWPSWNKLHGLACLGEAPVPGLSHMARSARPAWTDGAPPPGLALGGAAQPTFDALPDDNPELTGDSVLLVLSFVVLSQVGLPPASPLPLS